jgi:hypothetical protein
LQANGDAQARETWPIVRMRRPAVGGIMLAIVVRAIEEVAT